MNMNSRIDVSEFDIKTDNGKKFCKCLRTDSNVFYYTKEGKIDMKSLMEQTYGGAEMNSQRNNLRS